MYLLSYNYVKSGSGVVAYKTEIELISGCQFFLRDVGNR